MSVSAGLRRRPTLVRTGLRVLAAGFLLTLATAGPALAHADLAASTPADKAALAEPPATITLTFTEAIDPAKSSFKLNGAGGTIGTGRVAGSDTTMTLDGLALAPGAYEIRLTAAASDGHIERGTLTFTVTPPTTPTSSPGETPDPASPGDVLLPIVVALAAVAGIGAYLLRRSRRA